MPPQAGTIGACDGMPAARTKRRTLTKGASAPSAKRGSKSKVATSSGGGAGKAEKKRAIKDKNAAENSAKIRARVGAMQAKYGEELSFLDSEFTKLEAELAPEGDACASVGVAAEAGESGAQQQLARLRYFTAHVKNTTDRMEQAKNGLHQYTSAQLDMLEEHITQRLLPVKERMMAQLTQRPAAADARQADTEAPDNKPLSAFTNGAATAANDNRERTSSGDSDVSDSWRAVTESAGVDLGAGELTRPCSTLSLADLGDLCGDAEGDDCGGAYLVGGDCDDSVDGGGIGLELLDFGGQEDKESAFFHSPRDGSRGAGRSASMSTLSSMSAMTDGEFSDDSLSAEENYDGSKTVAVSEFSLSPSPTRSRARDTAIDQEMHELSELFAPDAFILSTVLDSEEEEVANSVQTVAAVLDSEEEGVANSARTVAAVTAVDPAAVVASRENANAHSKPAAGAAVEAGGDRFLLNVSKMHETGGGQSPAAATAISPPVLQSSSSDMRGRKLSLPAAITPQPTVSPPSSSSAAAVTAVAPSLLTAPPTQANARVAAAAAAFVPTTPSVVVKQEANAAAAVATAASATSTSGRAARGVVGVPSTAGAVVAVTQKREQQPPHECRCGEASCPSAAAAAAAAAASAINPRKRPSEFSTQENGTASSGAAAAGVSSSGVSSSGPVVSSGGGGMALPHVSAPRQRKRQRSLAPVLSAPRTVSYECSLCKENYQAEVASNPWWSLFRQECPRCHRTQIPRVDAASAATSVDYIHAVCAEEGEGCDSDGYGSESCSDSEGEDDDEYGEGIACFDTDVVAGDSSCTGGGAAAEGRLSTAQASRLLVLMAHARTCPGRHANSQHAEVCRSTKFLMLHIRDCTGRGPTGEPCEHRWCRPCKSLLSHLVRCPQPDTCRICTPLDLPGPLRLLRELNLAQARAVVTASSPDPGCSAPVKTEGCCHRLPSQANAMTQ